MNAIRDDIVLGFEVCFQTREVPRESAIDQLSSVLQDDDLGLHNTYKPADATYERITDIVHKVISGQGA
jgi:hypothetical protein